MRMSGLARSTPGRDPCALSKTIDYCILYPLLRKVGVQVGQRTLAYGRRDFNGQCARGGQVVFPGHFMYCRVDVFDFHHGERGEAQKDPVGTLDQRHAR